MKRIAITMGDPAGIGPEIIVKALRSDRIDNKCIPVIIGSRAIMEEAVRLTDSCLNFVFQETSTFSELQEGYAYLVDIGKIEDFKRRVASASGGHASIKCIRKAVQLCLDKKVDAMVTAPISKEAIHLAQYSWPGHTEMLGELTGSEQVGMMFVAASLKVILVTIHTAIRSAVEMISEKRVLDSIFMATKACNMLSIASPRIAVAGLNPHAGEEGLFGNEEKDHLIPAIEKARERGIDAKGPFPPDIVFKKALEGNFDIVVAMYHDQGLIPLKLLYFDRGVNVTVGLPIIRTSPDHGTAYDIAWKGIANPSSMIEAILVAERMKI